MTRRDCTRILGGILLGVERSVRVLDEPVVVAHDEDLWDVPFGDCLDDGVEFVYVVVVEEACRFIEDERWETVAPGAIAFRHKAVDAGA